MKNSKEFTELTIGLQSLVSLHPKATKTQGDLIIALCEIIIEQFSVEKLKDFYKRIADASKAIQSQGGSDSATTSSILDAIKKIDAYFELLKNTYPKEHDPEKEEKLDLLSEKLAYAKDQCILVKVQLNRLNDQQSQTLPYLLNHAAKAKVDIALRDYITRIEKGEGKTKNRVLDWFYSLLELLVSKFTSRKNKESLPSANTFKAGFTYSTYRALNREANYHLACQLKKELADPKTTLQTFEKIEEKRTAILGEKNIHIPRFFNRGLKSNQLKTVIREGSKILRRI